MSLCLPTYQIIKTYGGVEIQLHVFLTSAIDGGDWSVSSPGRFTPEERAPGTHWIGGWRATAIANILQVPRLRMRGDKTPLPHTSLYRFA
jgi:hypothetical protein